MCKLMSFAIWIFTPALVSEFWPMWDQRPGAEMFMGGDFISGANLSHVTFTCILQHNPRRKSAKGATLSGLVTRSTYCLNARHGTRESSLEKHKWGIEHSLVSPGTRGKCLYVHQERHTIKFTFTQIPTGCNSCVENELLRVVLARGMEGWRGGYTYGGRGGLARVASNVLLPQDALHAQNKP